MAILTASLDDLVFEGRNQAYGAYELRRDYQRRLASAGGTTLGLCTLLLIGILFWPKARPQVTPTSKPLELTRVQVEPIKTVIERPKLAAVPPPPAARAATHVAAAHPTQVAKDNLVPPAPKPVVVETAVPDGLVGQETKTGALDGSATATSTTDGPGTESTTTTAAETTGTFTIVEKMPEFSGGQAALLRYLRDHLRYPSRALAAGVEGRVFLSFVVKADGTIDEVTVLKGLGYGLDEEAQRVVRQMPAWVPGYQAHHAVAVRFTLPLTFQIQ